MREPAPTVYVVDDDPDVLRAIERLLESVGLTVATFSSPHRFLESYDRSAPGCLVLDLALPAEHLDERVAREGLFDLRVELTGVGPLRHEELLRALGDDRRDDKRERHRDERDERQDRRDHEHHDDDADDREQRGEQLEAG